MTIDEIKQVILGTCKALGYSLSFDNPSKTLQAYFDPAHVFVAGTVHHINRLDLVSLMNLAEDANRQYGVLGTQIRELNSTVEYMTSSEDFLQKRGGVRKFYSPGPNI